jgi:hypothetical protein
MPYPAAHRPAVKKSIIDSASRPPGRLAGPIHPCGGVVVACGVRVGHRVRPGVRGDGSSIPQSFPKLKRLQEQGPPPRLFCAKSSESHENKRVEFFVSAKECASV